MFFRRTMPPSLRRHLLAGASWILPEPRRRLRTRFWAVVGFAARVPRFLSAERHSEVIGKPSDGGHPLGGRAGGFWNQARAAVEDSHDLG